MFLPPSFNHFLVEKDELSAYVENFHFDIPLFAYWYQGEIRRLRNLLLNHIKIAFTTVGSCRISTVDQEYIASPGDVFIIPPYTLHHADFITDGPVESFEFHVRVIEPHMQQWFIDNLHGQIFFPGVVTADFYQRIKHVYEQTRAYAPGSYLLTKNILSELLLLSLNYSSLQNPVTARSPGSREKTVSAFLQYVDLHYCDSIRMEDICQHLHLSRSYLSRCLQEVLGTTAGQYITRYRMLRAQELLKSGKTIQEVSDRLNFSSVYYFSRLYKQHFHEPPSSCIRSHQKTP
ncbi:MAG: helix-turn-helix transcriptional regulator [Lachnospiraceae bacterium]|nr:helix-turn-helix transcriptional regulator [Lachnospiraceae bacterium]